MKKIRIILLLLPLLAAGLVSCEKDPAPEPPVGKKHRTVIEYMVADNNLYSNAEDNINDMEAAWDPAFDGHMVVYLHPVAATSSFAPNRANYDPLPRLLLISRDQTSTITSRVLKTYSRDQNPSDPAVMAQVIADAMELAPADNYALVLWSHGSGWLPVGGKQPTKSVVPGVSAIEGPVSKLVGSYSGAAGGAESQAADGIVSYSFGQSLSHNGSEMEVDALVAALPAGTVFDFILFDACHMACVEVAWELRNRTEYTIGSVAETLATGFPYLKIMKPMFASGKADVEAIAREFITYYEAQSGYSKSGTVSVVRSSALPALAAAMKNLCEVSGLPASGISYAGQQFGRERDATFSYYYGFGNTFYDLGDFADRTWSGSDPARVAAFEAALAAAVPYKFATSGLFYNQIVVNRHSGLSCYLPRTSTPISLAAYRTRFGWSAASGMGQLVP